MTEMPKHDQKKYTQWADNRRVYLENLAAKKAREEIIRNHAENNPACRRWS